MAIETILIIEDDPDIIELARYNLERERFKVLDAETGEKGLNLAISLQPSLILLDLGLPGIQGLDVCRVLRQRNSTKAIPIIMLTARGEESDVVVGLEMGADDYIPKPFKIRELVARVRAVLRRSQSRSKGASDDQIVVGPLVIDSARHEVLKDGEPIALTLSEFKVLRMLASNPGRVFTREQFLNEITNGAAYIIDRNVDVHVRAIRKKLGDARGMISTVRGVGYKFQNPARATSRSPG
jgi:DNA-binding response OmpR family regulator